MGFVFVKQRDTDIKNNNMEDLEAQLIEASKQNHRFKNHRNRWSFQWTEL